MEFEPTLLLVTYLDTDDKMASWKVALKKRKKRRKRLSGRKDDKKKLKTNLETLFHT